MPQRFINGHNSLRQERPPIAGPIKIPNLEICYLVPLTKGQWVLISQEDLETVQRHAWFARWNEDTKSYYAMRKGREGNKRVGIALHRELLGLPLSGRSTVGDHKNCITLDCRRSNLRKGTMANNCRNRRTHKNSKTGLKGVYLVGDRFGARMWIDGKLVTLKVCDTAQEASDVVFAEAQKRYGQFARRG